MPHSALELCLPSLLLIAALLFVLRILVALCGARLNLGRLRELNSNEVGGVQSLSFVMTLPLFIMIMMGIVQVSQLMIARIFVQYAAVAAARSAIVWIPATLVDADEGANEIRDLVLDDQQDASANGTYYRVVPGSNKAMRIQMAAAQALMPIAPSRDTQAAGNQNQPGFVAYESILRAYQALAPASANDSSISRRLANKLSYCLQNTQVDIRIFHPSSEPDLATWFVPDDEGEFYANEIGWQDSITVKVTHSVALLPGPGGMLAKYFSDESSQSADNPSPIIQNSDTYTWPLSASATLVNEGQKPLIRYDHLSTGIPL